MSKVKVEFEFNLQEERREDLGDEFYKDELFFSGDQWDETQKNKLQIIKNGELDE